MSNCREEFEKWFESEYPNRCIFGTDKNNGYYSRLVASAWSAWQAARSQSSRGEAVAWRVDGTRNGNPEIWFYYKPDWPKAHLEHGDKVTPLYAAPGVVAGEVVYQYRAGKVFASDCWCDCSGKADYESMDATKRILYTAPFVADEVDVNDATELKDYRELHFAIVGNQPIWPNTWCQNVAAVAFVINNERQTALTAAIGRGDGKL